MELHLFSFAAMGTACRIHLYAGSEKLAREAAQAGAEQVGRLERRYSRYRPDSVLAEVNRAAAAGNSVAVDEETAALLDHAAACHAASGSRFDVTAGVLRRAWDFGRPHLPKPEAVAALLPLVGFDKLDWRAPVLHFPVAGMELDLGGIVKEYAADCAAQACAACGTAHGIVELGGDIRVVGPQPDGTPWPVGIRHPRRPDIVMATVGLTEGGLATSGDYERFFEVEGRRYCHLLDPRTGWPVRELASVSVAAESCLVAGTVATMAMLHQAEGKDWLAASGRAHLWMDEAGNQGGDLSPPAP